MVDAFEQEPDADLVSGDCVRIDSDSGATYLLFQPPPYRDWLIRTGYLEKETIEGQGDMMRAFWNKYGVQISPQVKQAYGVK